MNWNSSPRMFEIIQRFRWHRRRLYLKGYAVVLFRNWGVFSPAADGGLYTIPADLLDPIVDRLTARAMELAECDARNVEMPSMPQLKCLEKPDDVGR